MSLETGIIALAEVVGGDVKALDSGKADKLHTHTISDVTGLPTRLNDIEALVSSSDEWLRQDLANPDKGAAMVSYGGGTVADKLDEIVSGAVTEPIVDAKVLAHNHDANSHPELSAFISEEADRAEAARDAAFINADVFPDVAYGRAAVADGDQFQVVAGDEIVRYRRDSSTTQTEVARYPGSAYVDESVRYGVIGEPAQNLIDPRFIIEGRGLDSYGNVTTAGAFAEYGITHFLPVSGDVYSANFLHRIAFYDATKTFIETGSAGNGLSIPVGSEYVRISLLLSNMGSATFELWPYYRTWQPFRLRANDRSVDIDSLDDYAVTARSISLGSINPYHIDPSQIEFDNIHDGRWFDDQQWDLTYGETLASSSTASATDYLPVEPGTTYALRDPVSRTFCYDECRKLLQIFTNAATFTTPEDCRLVRFNVSNPVKHRFQFNKGSEPNSQEALPNNYTLKGLKGQVLTRQHNAAAFGRIYNLADAWRKWNSGEKFPVAFIGDSTTQGTGTTGSARPTPSEDHWGEDYIRENAYPAVLEGIVRSASGSTTARCYNLGYHGRNASWAVANIGDIVSGDYADTKMLGISFGINDRGGALTDDLVAANFRDNIETIIVWCYENSIQPFLLTTQPVLEPGDQVPTVDTQTSERAHSVTNAVKHELADKWGLEVVDINKYGREIQTYSEYPLYSNPQGGIYEANSNSIHWGDLGHEIEAGILFAHICPRVIWTEKGERLDFSTQQVVSDVDRTLPQQLAVFNNGFKVEAKYTKENTNDILLQDFWLFSLYRGVLGITAFASDSPESAHVDVDGDTASMAEVVQQVGSLDMGLHRIRAYSGATTAVNWLGFKVEP